MAPVGQRSMQRVHSTAGPGAGWVGFQLQVHYEIRDEEVRADLPVYEAGIAPEKPQPGVLSRRAFQQRHGVGEASGLDPGPQLFFQLRPQSVQPLLDDLVVVPAPGVPRDPAATRSSRGARRGSTRRPTRRRSGRSSGASSGSTASSTGRCIKPMSAAIPASCHSRSRSPPSRNGSAPVMPTRSKPASRARRTRMSRGFLERVSCMGH